MTEDRWVSVEEGLPKHNKKPGTFGVEVLIAPQVDGLATAFYGRRVTNKPGFYRHGAAIHDITHWRYLPALPTEAIS